MNVTSPAKDDRQRRWVDEFVRLYGVFHANEAVGAVRHDLLNRLTAIGAVTFRLKRILQRVLGETSGGENSEELWGSFPIINEQIVAASRSFERTALPRLDGAQEPCDVSATILDVLQLQGLADSALESGTSTMVQALIAPGELAVAFFCLLDNALFASPAKGHVTVRCLHVPASGAVIEVSDRGKGLDADAMSHAFERFFTTKPGHVGLGLNIAKGIAERWGGSVELGARTDTVPGTVASLRIPLGRDP